MLGQGVSGSTLDRRHGFIAATNAEEQIDILVGDWMSEANMPSAQARKLSSIGVASASSNAGDFFFFDTPVLIFYLS